MKNADKFKNVFGLYATEVWSMPEGEFLRWLNSESTEIEQRWIPCSERLPEKEVVYIITVHYGDRNFIAFDNFCSYKHGWKEWSNQEVLAWMPLPEPYKEGQG